MFSDSAHDRMFREEMERQVAVREGEKVERTTIERAALRAIALKAAKGDARAYKALADKQVAIDKRQQIVWERWLDTILDYQNCARQQLKLDRKMRKTRPEIIPHPDDIEIDLNNRSVIINGPITADQKMAQDFLMSNRSKILPFFEELRFAKVDRQFFRQIRNLKRQMDTVSQLVLKRASKINSWETATTEERTEFLWREIWPSFCEDLRFPFAMARSELCFRSAFRSYLGIELTDEEQRELVKELRAAIQIEWSTPSVPSDRAEHP